MNRLKLIAPSPKVAAAIVTFNKREPVLKLLKILEELGIPTFITENASSDGTKQAIREQFPYVSMLESSENLGGTGGFNCAVLAALSTGCEYVILLDDDVYPALDCIEKLTDFLDTHPEYVFVAPAIYISSKPDTLQETGGSVDFSRPMPVEAWNRFAVNPKLPEYLDIDYASACCLMVRSKAIRKIGVMDWNYFIFSDDVDFSLRLRQSFGKAACVTTAKAWHDFPWAKPFSPMRLYFFRRNGLYLISRMRGTTETALYHALTGLFKDWIYSWAIGDHEISSTLKSAFYDAWNDCYGKWKKPVRFGVCRKKLDSEFFQKHRIRRVLLDITIEDFDAQALAAIRACGGNDIVIDILCDAHRVEVYDKKRMFSGIFGRNPKNLLRTLGKIWMKRYDLVVTDAFMAPRRPTSMAGKHAAFSHDGALYEASCHPLIACAAYAIALLAGKWLTWLAYKKFLNPPEPGLPPEEARPILELIGVNSPTNPTLFEKERGASFEKEIVQPFLGPGEENGGYDAWCQYRDKIAPSIYRIQHQGETPLFSILVPVGDPRYEWLRECIDSVRCQTYEGWEMILSDDASRMSYVKPVLEDAAKKEPRIKIVLSDKWGGISENTNRAAERALGEYLFFLDHDDILDIYALAAFAQAINEKPDTDILYADEDRFTVDRRRIYPGFKPRYSPDRLMATNYMHHPVAIKKGIYVRLGGLRSQYDGSQDHDLLLRAAEITDKIVHIPDVLYHMRLHPGSLAEAHQAKPEAHERDRKLIAEAMKRRGMDGVVEPIPSVPGYSAIRLKYPDVSVSVLIIPEMTSPPAPLQRRGELEIPSFGGIDWGGFPPFGGIEGGHGTVPEQCNALIKQAEGDILIIASSAIQPDSGWEKIIIPHIMRQEIGLVTGKIVYHDNRLHSCGLVLGIAGAAGRWHHQCIASDPGYGGWMVLDHEVSAVPWQFMGIRKSLFIEAGGFDPAFKHNGFDIDLALRLTTQLGLRHLAIPGARLKLAKGYPETVIEKWEIEDLALLWKRWGYYIRQGDPYFNPNFSLYNEDVYLIDEKEAELRACGAFAAYDTATAQILGKRLNRFKI